MTRGVRKLVGIGITSLKADFEDATKETYGDNLSTMETIGIEIFWLLFQNTLYQRGWFYLNGNRSKSWDKYFPWETLSLREYQLLAFFKRLTNVGHDFA